MTDTNYPFANNIVALQSTHACHIVSDTVPSGVQKTWLAIPSRGGTSTHDSLKKWKLLLLLAIQNLLCFRYKTFRKLCPECL